MIKRKSTQEESGYSRNLRLRQEKKEKKYKRGKKALKSIAQEVFDV